MVNNNVVTLNGNTLTVNEIVAIGIGDKKVELDNEALKKCHASRTYLEEKIKAEHIIYGVNTSFGPMCNKIISKEQIEKLQVNLIKSHAAGLGEPLKPYMAISILVVRLNSLIKGFSGVRISLLELLRDMINNGIAPYIPECGSVGASGDLIHLAHMALAVIGEGQVYYKGKLCKATEAFTKTGLKPFKLSYKEGIALINGTAAMTALGAFVVFSAKKALNIACVNAAFAVEIFGGINDAFDIDLHKVKPHIGQVKIAEIIRNLIRNSQNITLRKNVHAYVRNQDPLNGQIFETDINVQDVYSIRCTPQILSPVYETIAQAEKIVELEANSTNDNPVIIPEEEKIIHGGNFHGQNIAFIMDSLCIAISTMCNLSERRLNKILDKHLNEGLPEFLITGTPGLTMGFMGAQYLSTSTTAENRALSNPVSTNSISCNQSNQDVVSMGTVAARKAIKQISNAKHILTLEMLADLQAFSFRNSDKLGKGTEALYQILKKDFKVYDNSDIFHKSLVKFRKLLFSSQIFDDISIYWKS